MKQKPIFQRFAAVLLLSAARADEMGPDCPMCPPIPLTGNNLHPPTATAPGTYPTYPSYPNATGPPGNGTYSNATAPSRAGPPVWNLRNVTCDSMDYLKTGYEQWLGVGGDWAWSNLTRAFQGNYTFCPECMGFPQSECPQAQPDHPEYNADCTQGLQDISDNRLDRAAARYAHDIRDTDLSCGLDVSGCVVSADCNATLGPSLWATLKSLSTLNDLLYNTYEAINNAENYCNSQMDAFKADFAPPPPPATGAAWFGLLNSFIGAVGGFMSIAAPEAGIALSVAGAFANSAVGIAQASSPSSSADPSKPMGNIAQAAIDALKNVTDQLFQTGTATYPKAPDNSTSLSLAEIFQGGQMMMGPTDYGKYQSQLVESFKKSLFQQTAVYTWRNLDTKKVVPYIAFETGSCSSNANGGPLDQAIPGIDRGDTAVDIDGSCYYLLGAVIQTTHSNTPCIGPTTSSSCVGQKALPGGTHAILTGSADQYAGLKLDDFVIPSVKGWQDAKNSNLYPPAVYGGNLITDIQQPAVVSLPVCDYVHQADSPGIGCPKLEAVEPTDDECSIHMEGINIFGFPWAKRSQDGRLAGNDRSPVHQKKSSRVMQRC